MSYYYLISGLPDLSLDQLALKIDSEEIIDTIQRNLNLEDEQLFRFLLYPNDNRNLLNALLAKYKNIQNTVFISPSVFSELIIQDYAINKATLPNYMIEFLDSYEDQFQSMSPRKIEDLLWEKFYQEVVQKDAFLTNYLIFEQELKELAAWYNTSRYDFLKKAPSKNEAASNQFGNTKPILKGLPGVYPYSEKLGEAITAGLPDKIEQCIDRIKWDYLSQISGFFGREQVFVYVLKLLLILRWQGANAVDGERHFMEIQQNIRHSIHSSLIPEI